MFCVYSYAQDTLGLRIRSEVFPIYSGIEASLGEGLGVELQKRLAPTTRLGIAYSKLTFDGSASRNAEVVFYSESDGGSKLRASIGFGFFIRQWEDHLPEGKDRPEGTERFLTTGYVISLGTLGRLTDRVGFSIRATFNNNMESEITYSVRPGIIITL